MLGKSVQSIHDKLDIAEMRLALRRLEEPRESGHSIFQLPPSAAATPSPVASLPQPESNVSSSPLLEEGSDRGDLFVTIMTVSISLGDYN